ncbi:hypothetical protein RIF23_05195 [Lipingzhangella sp. LS1_29]|uniref:Uncharacterized protein n=1 Tax=Lipingzhangella rawalii TaxID=2055835 RepID=A0ABU2H4A7_9ACTN|nr:hypothetical protein [Lipingzhangella rawalii]MDS1269685.1 hypothetical protein [Lipingzhangella rawalii]
MALFPLALVVELGIDGSWVDITGDVRTREDIAIVRGRPDEGDTVDPGKCTVVLNNRHGRYSPRNPRSPYYGLIGRNTPLRVGVRTEGETIVWRFHGEVSAWPARWDLSGNDRWVPIEAAGILRRLDQQHSALQTALRRVIQAHRPVAYWILDDPESAGSRGASAVPGGRRMRWAERDHSTGSVHRMTPQWKEAELAPWLEETVRTDKDRGIASGSVPGVTSSWAADMIRVGRGGQDNVTIATQTSGGTEVTWYLLEDPTVSPREVGVSVRTDAEGEAEQTTVLASAPALWMLDDEPHHVRFTVAPEGAGAAWSVSVDGDEVLSGTADVPAAPVTQWAYEWWVPDEDVSEHLGLGHVTVWGTDRPSTSAMVAAMRGHAGEPAARRIERLCAEADIPVRIVGDPDETLPMGPQAPDGPLDLVREAAEVDGGVLYESREEFGLTYRTLRSIYNRGAQLVDNQ